MRRNGFLRKTYIRVCAYIEERLLLVGVLLFRLFVGHSLLGVAYTLGGRVGHNAENGKNRKGGVDNCKQFITHITEVNDETKDRGYNLYQRRTAGMRANQNFLLRIRTFRLIMMFSS